MLNEIPIRSLMPDNWYKRSSFWQQVKEEPFYYLIILAINIIGIYYYGFLFVIIMFVYTEVRDVLKQALHTRNLSEDNFLILEDRIDLLNKQIYIIAKDFNAPYIYDYNYNEMTISNVKRSILRMQQELNK